MQEAYCPPRSKCSLCWWGVPHPVMVGEGYPIQSWWGGTPNSHGGGYPIQSWWGVPHPDLAGGVPRSNCPTIQTWPGVTWVHLPSRPCRGTPTIKTWLGYPPPPSRPGWGTPPNHQDLAGVPPTIHSWLGYPRPPLPSRCGLTNKLKTVPFPILGMRTVIISYVTVLLLLSEL